MAEKEERKNPRLIDVILVIAAIVVSGLVATEAMRQFKEEMNKQMGLLKKENQSLKKEIGKTKSELGRLANRFWPLPATIRFCGQRVPLEKWDVKERLEREYYLFLGDQAQIILYLKRVPRYFPKAEKRLKAAGLPDQLKYMMVAESALLPRAYSNKGAAGIWQFIPQTGRRFNLKSDRWLDERANFELATEAAISYLKFLNRKFRGDWLLALAAYNCGESLVKKSLEQQQTDNFYQLALPQESERYVSKIIALNLILENPKKYGLDIPDQELYQPSPTEKITVVLKQKTKVVGLAKKYGSYYREFKMLNPEIKSDILPKGRYTFQIPKAKMAAGSKTAQN